MYLDTLNITSYVLYLSFYTHTVDTLFNRVARGSAGLQQQDSIIFCRRGLTPTLYLIVFNTRNLTMMPRLWMQKNLADADRDFITFCIWHMAM